MKIICKRMEKSQAAKRGSRRRKRGLLLLCALLAGGLTAAARGTLPLSRPGQAEAPGVRAVSPTEPAPQPAVQTSAGAEEDVLPEEEEIDTGVSVGYDGKLDIPGNVRLDRLDFGSEFTPPLKTARVTSRFDYRVNPVTGRYVFHTGIDLGAPQGAAIYAMKAGRVVKAAHSSGYGNYVILEHADGIRTLCAHCSRLLVSQGDAVRKGQVIARVGSTGRSTGPHLHLEFRRNGCRYDPEWVIGGLYG